MRRTTARTYNIRFFPRELTCLRALPLIDSYSSRSCLKSSLSRVLMTGSLSTVNLLYLGLVISYLWGFKGIFFAIKTSNLCIWKSKNWLYAIKNVIIEFKQWHFLSGFCGVRNFNYTRKEGVIVFLYQKILNPLINSMFQYKPSVIYFTLTNLKGGERNGR